MTLAPLLQASPVVQIHAYAALAAFALGVVQIAAPKGTLPHRTVGFAWALLMLAVAVSALFIHEIRMLGPWSPIHLLALLVLFVVPLAVWRAHKHEVGKHRRAMLSLFFGALIIAGIFTLMPGRVIHAVMFGG